MKQEQYIRVKNRIMEKSEKMKEEIAKILDMNPELLIYETRQNKEGRHVLDLTTISPNKHRTRFLFHSAVAANAGGSHQSHV